MPRRHSAGASGWTPLKRTPGVFDDAGRSGFDVDAAENYVLDGSFRIVAPAGNIL